jgi:MFS family permease
VLTALCLTEIVSWGVLYYAFPVLAPGIAADTGWSPTAISAAFSAGLVTSALVGIPVGRILDRGGPRAVMTAGSVLAGLAVGLVAWSPTLAVFAIA